MSKQCGDLSVKQQSIELLDAECTLNTCSSRKAGPDGPIAPDERRPIPPILGLVRDRNPRRNDIVVPFDPALEVLRVGDLAQRLFHDETKSECHIWAGIVTPFASLGSVRQQPAVQSARRFSTRHSALDPVSGFTQFEMYTGFAGWLPTCHEQS